MGNRETGHAPVFRSAGVPAAVLDPRLADVQMGDDVPVGGHVLALHESGRDRKEGRVHFHILARDRTFLRKLEKVKKSIFLIPEGEILLLLYIGYT